MPMIRMTNHQILPVDTNVNGIVYPKNVVDQVIDRALYPIDIREYHDGNTFSDVAYIKDFNIVDGILLADIELFGGIKLYDDLINKHRRIAYSVVGDYGQLEHYQVCIAVHGIRFSIDD